MQQVIAWESATFDGAAFVVKCRWLVAAGFKSVHRMCCVPEEGTKQLLCC